MLSVKPSVIDSRHIFAIFVYSVFESRVLAQELKKAAINREKTRERRKRTDRAGQRKWETMVVLKLC